MRRAAASWCAGPQAFRAQRQTAGPLLRDTQDINPMQMQTSPQGAPEHRSWSRIRHDARGFC
jgi:hypothetical protein